MITELHQSVLLQEAIDALQVKPGQWYIDGTFGRGGHTKHILKHGGKVIALDADQEAIEYGQEKFEKEISDQKLILIRENFNKLTNTVKNNGINEVAGILFDFGTSVDQLKSDTRGFSFEHDSELDMRMDDRLGVKAKDLLAILPEQQLAQLFWEVGGEEMSRSIAKAIVRTRGKQPLTTTQQLSTLIEQIKGGKRGKLHPATKVFQALRIAVNTELDSIREVLPQAFELLQHQGRLVTISFHEGEDRIVKHQMRDWQQHNQGTLITKHPIEPSQGEIENNPRSRSAKLRIFEKSHI